MVPDDAGRPAIAWHPEPITADADAIVGGDYAEQDRRHARSEAVAWLREVLADGPVPQPDLQRQAQEAGHSWGTVRRAGKAIGVKSIRDGYGTDGRWQWRLPAIDEHTPPPT